MDTSLPSSPSNQAALDSVMGALQLLAASGVSNAVLGQALREVLASPLALKGGQVRAQADTGLGAGVAALNARDPQEASSLASPVDGAHHAPLLPFATALPAADRNDSPSLRAETWKQEAPRKRSSSGQSTAGSARRPLVSITVQLGYGLTSVSVSRTLLDSVAQHCGGVRKARRRVREWAIAAPEFAPNRSGWVQDQMTQYLAAARARAVRNPALTPAGLPMGLSPVDDSVLQAAVVSAKEVTKGLLPVSQQTQPDPQHPAWADVPDAAAGLTHPAPAQDAEQVHLF